jgi:hypothetical protein
VRDTVSLCAIHPNVNKKKGVMGNVTKVLAGIRRPKRYKSATDNRNNMFCVEEGGKCCGEKDVS